MNFRVIPIPLNFAVQSKPGAGLVLCCVSTLTMFILLTVASCTSNGDFEALYKQASQALFLNDSSWARWVKAQPGLGHIFAYALLSFVLSLTLRGQRLFFAPLTVFLFGLAMEAIQIFIPTRGASWADVGSNVLGVAIGFGAYHLWVLAVRGRRLVVLP